MLQLTLALSGRVELELGAERLSGEAFAIAPDASHSFEGTGLVAHLFVASDGTNGRAITLALCAQRPVAPIAPQLLGDLRARLLASWQSPRRTDEALRALGKELIARLAGQDPRTQPLDPRIAKVIAWVNARLDQAVSLRDTPRW